MIIRRDIISIINEYKKFPVIAIMGPRQSGKTTLCKHMFKKHVFIDFDDPSIKLFAQEDPTYFLKTYENKFGIILDEFQYVPKLLHYIKIIVDEKRRPGYFVLTGSQNFLVNESISQTLAGRVGISTLLPLSIHELEKANLLDSYEDIIVHGGYPRIYAENLKASLFYSSYIQTYLEKDVRSLAAIVDLKSFQKFLTLCAGRIGQLLNIAELAEVAAVDQKTIHRWLSILEASYVIFLLKPFYKNFNKRLTKSPKLYFFDTGLVAYLLGIKNKADYSASPFRGNLFENFIVADFYKQYCNLGERPSLYFWRDQNGRVEIDCIVDKITEMVPLEIKASETISTRFFDSLKQFNEFSKTSPEHNYVIYAGDQKQIRRLGSILNWKTSGTLIKKILTKK